MEIDSLIMEIIDEIDGIVWFPGNMPQEIATLRGRPRASWGVAMGEAAHTSTRAAALVNVKVDIIAWADTAQERADISSKIHGAFTGYGFTPSMAKKSSVPTGEGMTAWATEASFSAYIDTKACMVYKSGG